MRISALLLAVLALGAPAASQATSPDEPPTRPNTPVPLDDDGLPVPEFWSYDPEERAYIWLDKPQIDPEDLAARPDAYADVLLEHGISFDPQAREIAVRGATLHDEQSLGYPIEYLVVNELGNRHEAIVLIRAMPSVLDSCLQALGLRPGAPTELEEKDPLPSEDDLQNGVTSPWWVDAGHGPLVDIDVLWVDDAGVRHETPLERMLIDIFTGEPLVERGWVYTGSRRGRYRQGRERVSWFKADVEGDVVAIYLEGLGVCLFERASLDGLQAAPYTLAPGLVPPRNTPVTLLFRPRDELVLPAERRDLLDILRERDAERAAEAEATPAGESQPAGDADGEPAEGG